MRRPIVLAAILSIVLAAGMSRAAEQEAQFPLGKAKLSMSSRIIAFSGHWAGAVGTMPNPMFDGATLRVAGGVGEGDSHLIRLPGGNWKATKKGYVYKDAK